MGIACQTISIGTPEISRALDPSKAGSTAQVTKTPQLSWRRGGRIVDMPQICLGVTNLGRLTMAITFDRNGSLWATQNSLHPRRGGSRRDQLKIVGRGGTPDAVPPHPNCSAFWARYR